MFDLFAVLIASSVGIFLFLSWRIQNRLKLQSASTDCVEVPSRQSRRYDKSALFDLLLNSGSVSPITDFEAFQDRFSTLSDLKYGKALKVVGLQRFRVIVGIDFSASNEWQGRRTFSRNSLHSCILRGNNPYQRAIFALEAALEPFLVHGGLKCYGFGDVRTKDMAVFTMNPDGAEIENLKELLKAYNRTAIGVKLSGPTSFVPIINKAIEVLNQEKEYTVLVIISDGQITGSEDENALIDASYYPLSVILVGVGDGPWDTMELFDDFVPERKFDNFQFVDLNKVAQSSSKKTFETTFALHALMELPDQYYAIRDLNYLCKFDSFKSNI